MSAQQKISIAHVIGSLRYGGAENQVVQVLNGLSKWQFKKKLMIFQYVDTENSSRLDPEIRVFNLRLKRWGQPVCIFNLYRLFKNLKIDLVQAHMFHANLYVAIAARLAGVPVVLTTEHGKNLWKRPIHHFIEKRIISPLVTWRVAVSKDIRNLRVTSGDVPKDKIAFIPNCVEILDKPLEYKKGERLQIGTVGRLVYAKDYGTLIKAFNMLIKDGIKGDLIFVGDGPERPKLESMVKVLGLDGHVTFTGFQGNVNSFLNRFDIFVLSSIREGIPVAMLEAMAMRVPVVSTKVGGIPEVIEDNVDGLLTDSRNPKMIADTLKRLSKDSSLRKKIGEFGFKKVKRQFSREAICRQYEQLYIDLLKDRYSS